MPDIHAGSPTVTEWRLPSGGSFVITDEIGTELFRVTASGDAVKVSGQSITAAALAELATLDGLTATAAELNVLDVSALPGTATATADGLTTGLVAAAGLVTFVTVTTDSADKIVTLPAPVPGLVVLLKNGATGYELRSSAPATVSINGGAEANAESAIAASTLVWAVCTSATTWQAWGIAATTLAAVEAAAAA